jgi:pantothenate kinase
MYDYKPVVEILKQFDMPRYDFKHARIIKTESLGPDSSAIVLVAGATYVLYQEDFIDDIDYITGVIEKWYPSKLIEYLKPKDQTKFEDSAGFQYFVNPDIKKVNKWYKWAVASGGDYCFLAKVESTAENDTFWANPVVTKLEDLPEDVQKSAKKVMGVDPHKPFLDEWLARKEF